MGFWSINPYVGCEYGCSYCYARYAHDYVTSRVGDEGHARALKEPFEQRIFVKRTADVAAALDRDLAKVRARSRRSPQNVVIGTATDPYQPAERTYLLTRTVLQRLGRERGFHIGVITKSPLVRRDLDVLVQLLERHRVSVYISLISVDVSLIRRFEARSPMPRVRLKALQRLSAAGVRAGLIVAPVLPGITDTAEQIAALMAAAQKAGARFVYPSVLRMYPETWERLLPLIEGFSPTLAQRYRVAYARRRDAPREYGMALRERFRRIANRFGIPETDGDAEQPRFESERQIDQLSLF